MPEAAKEDPEKRKSENMGRTMHTQRPLGLRRQLCTPIDVFKKEELASGNLCKTEPYNLQGHSSLTPIESYSDKMTFGILGA